MLAVAVEVGVRVEVAVAVSNGVGVMVGVGEIVGVAVIVAVAVAVAVAVGVAVGVGVGESVSVEENIDVGVKVVGASSTSDSARERSGERVAVMDGALRPRGKLPGAAARLRSTADTLARTVVSARVTP
jgi:hypothetical protein